MDKEVLRRYLELGLSLPQIGALERRHPSTVGYWIKKHGLVANGRDKYAPRGGLTREQLEPLVARGETLEVIAGKLERSIATVRYWIKRHGLTSPKQARRRQVERVIASGSRMLVRECPRHGVGEFIIENSGRTRCKSCRSEAVVNWRRRVKKKLIDEAGGQCVLCGYDRYQGALQFHHLDPSEKEFAISREGVSRSFAEARAEATKCVLLCGNCHAEVEAGWDALIEDELEGVLPSSIV